MAADPSFAPVSVAIRGCADPSVVRAMSGVLRCRTRASGSLYVDGDRTLRFPSHPESRPGPERVSTGGVEAAAHGRRQVAALDRSRTVLPERRRHHLGHELLVRGDPRRVIPEKVQELGAAVLGLGTVARTGVQGFVIGNTAEEILQRVDCTVVVFRPS